MKKYLITFIVLCIVVLGMPYFNLNANQIEGKNLFNPEAFNVDALGLYSTQVIEVEGNISYVLSFPSKAFLGGELSDVEILVTDNLNYEMIIEPIQDWDQCYEVDDRHVCPFVTNSNSEHINIKIDSIFIEDYITQNGYLNFQLEVGVEVTSYEPYQASNSEPYFQGDGNLITSYTSSLTLNNIIGTHITAHDEIDGDLTGSIVVVTDAYTGNETTVGNYNVLLEVSDSSGNTTQFLMTIHVVDDVAPVITGPAIIELGGFSNTLLDTIITNNFVFEDEVDGIISEYQIDLDEYTLSENVLGDKNITISIQDQAGNQTSQSFIIRVIDNTPPIIEGPSSIRLNLSETPSYATIRNALDISDDYTLFESLIIEFINCTLPESFDVTGNYETTLKVTDAAGNSTTKILNVEIYDDIPPTLTGPSIIKTPYHQSLTLNDILNHYIVSDNYKTLTKEDIVVIENLYNPISYDLGYFKIRLQVSDDNHTIEHVVHIHVVDDIPPVFNLSERILVEVGTKITVEQLFNILVESEDFGEFSPVGLRYTEDVSEIFKAPGKSIITVELYNAQDEIMHYDIVLETFEAPRLDLFIPMVLSFVGIVLFISLGYLIYKRK